MNVKLVPAMIAFAVGSAVTIAGPAVAGGSHAPTTVTIKAENGDLSGRVKSTRPMVCAQGRKVIVYKQVGSQQDPSVDERVGTDTAGLNGDRYEWSTGNSGTFGKVYALVRRTPDCKADRSDTIRSRQP
ncbi:MAG TPA: hypothetical protein VI341_00400 [Actinomycetota bacterium]